MIPQLIMIILNAISLGSYISKHGQDKKPEKYNAWIKFLAIVLSFTILYYGGFWDVIIK